MNVLGKPQVLLFVLFVLSVLLPVQTLAQEISATLQWVRTVPLSTAVSGVIEKVNVSTGERVSRGQQLMSLVDKTFQANVLARKAALKKAENNRDEARRERERTQELYDRTLLSDHDLQLAKIQFDAAMAELQIVRAALIKAEQDIYYSVVRAPFDAWVMKRDAQPGQTVVVNLQITPLLVLAEAGRMLARGTVDEASARKIKRGQMAQVVVAGKNYAGKVSLVSLEPVKSSVDEYAVEVIFKTGQSVLRVGQSATVRF